MGAHTRRRPDRGRHFWNCGSLRNFEKKTGQVVVVELEAMLTVSKSVGVSIVPTDVTTVVVAAASSELVEVALSVVVAVAVVVASLSVGAATAELVISRTMRTSDRIVNLAL